MGKPLPVIGQDDGTWGAILNDFLTALSRAVSDLAVNVQDYGAVGDGKTDSTAAIQKAIDDVCETGGIVFLPPGDYVIKKTLDFSAMGPVQKAVTFRGAGGGGANFAARGTTRIVNASGGPAIGAVGATGPGHASGYPIIGLGLEGFTIHNTGPIGAGNFTIYLQNPENCHLTDLFVVGSGYHAGAGSGIAVLDAGIGHCTLTRCEVVNFGDFGGVALADPLPPLPVDRIGLPLVSTGFHVGTTDPRADGRSEQSADVVLVACAATDCAVGYYLAGNMDGINCMGCKAITAHAPSGLAGFLLRASYSGSLVGCHAEAFYKGCLLDAAYGWTLSSVKMTSAANGPHGSKLPGACGLSFTNGSHNNTGHSLVFQNDGLTVSFDATSKGNQVTGLVGAVRDDTLSSFGRSANYYATRAADAVDHNWEAGQVVVEREVASATTDGAAMLLACSAFKPVFDMCVEAELFAPVVEMPANAAVTFELVDATATPPSLIASLLQLTAGSAPMAMPVFGKHRWRAPAGVPVAPAVRVTVWQGGSVTVGAPAPSSPVSLRVRRTT